MARTATRELSFMLIFQADFGQGVDYAGAITEFGRKVDPHFLRGLVEDVLSRQEYLDEVIAKFARGWTVARLPRIDRAILRLATWELLGTDTPPAVVINEAVELAKDYGNAESPSFINGILDSIKTQKSELAGELGN